MPKTKTVRLTKEELATGKLSLYNVVVQSGQCDLTTLALFATGHGPGKLLKITKV